MRKATIILVCVILSIALGPATETAERLSPGPGVDDGARAGRQALAAAAGPLRPAASWRDTGFRLPEGQRISTIYRGDANVVAELTRGLAEPTALAAADFDGDGVADLVCGYAGPLHGYVTLHRGNVSAIYPAGTGAQSPFVDDASVYSVPARPDFLATGDFDNDGRMDLALASRGATTLHVLSRDERGELAPSMSVELGGALTTMIAGEINRPDGLVDLVLAIEREDSAALLVFEGPGGALMAEPEMLPLPAPASGLALGQLDADVVGRELAVAAGRQLLIVQGRNRWLTLGEARRAEVADPLVRSIDLPAPVRDVAVGDFVQEADHRSELAVLLQDGSVSLLAREDAGGWRSAGTWSVQAIGQPVLLTARLSGQPTHELVVLDPGSRRLSLLRGGDPRSFRVEPQLDGTARPIAALPLRLNPDAVDDLVLLTADATAPVVMASTASVTLTVQHHGDGSDELTGDGTCSTSGSDPTTCTLRAALEEANALAGPDTINFGITSGSTIIEPLAPLAVISDPVTLDATTQAGYAGSPIVELSGGFAGPSSGLVVTAGSSVVRGLVIRDWDGRGIELLENGDNIVEANFIGTDVTGRVAQGNAGSGILVVNTPTNTIGGAVAQATNLVSDNDPYGISISQAGSTGNLVLGNRIGTDWSGSLKLGNRFDGIAIFSAASQNTVGGTAAGAGNLISGNGRGIAFWNGSANHVLGNLIGTDVLGTSALGNTNMAMWIASQGAETESHDNLIGGTAVGAGNVISACVESTCIYMEEGSYNQQFLGNLMGTDITGTVDLGAVSFHAMSIVDSPDNVVGGTVPGARNIISGNEIYGVAIWNAASTGNEVLGNYIGTDITGMQSIPNGYDGIHLETASQTVIGGSEAGARNLLSGNGQHGLSIWNAAANNQVLGNYIGTDVTGEAILANAWDGVSLSQASPDNTIGGIEPGEGNVISGNGRFGIAVYYIGTTGNEVLGNFIGTDVTGTVALGNTDHGIYVNDAPGNAFGGTADGAGNLISGNGVNGIEMLNPLATGNQILGNLIGTDVSGMSALGNLGRGVRIRADAASNVIGGAAPGARNVISASGTWGVVLLSGASSNQVLGNHIGTDAAGTSALSNAYTGVLVQDAPDNIVGGVETGAGNLISGNGQFGVYVLNPASTGNRILGNRIGTDIDGNSALGNGSAGVRFQDCSDNAVGGTFAAAANVIADNFRGVVVKGDLPTNNNSILGNSIFDNLELGIDLNPPDGITPNDPMDPDTGPNGLQNFPSLSSASATPADVTIQGTLNSKSTERYRVEFFTSSECDDSGYGEAERYLGFTEVITDFGGNGSFNVVLPAPVSDGDMITTTATDATGNTSELCGCVEASCSSLATFTWTVIAQDTNTWVWAAAEDVRFVKGDLAQVVGYVTSDDGTLFGASTLDMSTDAPGVGSGMYYIVRPLGCGSWQTAAGAQPARDLVLP